MNNISGSYINVSGKKAFTDLDLTELFSDSKVSVKEASWKLGSGQTTDIFFQKEPLGNFTYELSLSKSCRVKKAVLRIKGIRYEGRLKSLGVSITPVDKRIFIVDFHSFRTLTKVEYKNPNIKITEVKQWGGISFLENNILSENLLLIKTEKVLVTLDTEVTPSSFEDNFHITIISYPLNLTLSLGDENPFWSYAGELISEVTVPDFSEKLNNYLEVFSSEKTSDIVCKIPFKFHSDSPGNTEITEEIDSNLIWKSPLSDSYPEKKVPALLFDGNDKKIHFELKSSKKLVQLISIGFNCKGSFSKEFIDDNWGDTEIKNMGILLSTEMSAGLKFSSSCSLSATGIDLYLLKRDDNTKLFVEVMEDQDGKPAEEKILGSNNVELISGQNSWTAIKFDEAISLEKEKAYWLVLKVSIGKVEWVCSENMNRPEGFAYKKELAGSWNYYSLTNKSSSQKTPLTGYFRLKYLPDSEEIFPITLRMNKKSEDLKPSSEPELVKMDLQETPQLEVKEGKVKIDFEIISRTSGKLELSDVTVEGKELM
jgi:hypothetical protein